MQALRRDMLCDLEKFSLVLRRSVVDFIQLGCFSTARQNFIRTSFAIVASSTTLIVYCHKFSALAQFLGDVSQSGRKAVIVNIVIGLK